MSSLVPVSPVFSPSLYIATSKRLAHLEAFYELATLPDDFNDMLPEDMALMQASPTNLAALRSRLLEVRRIMNSHLPPFPKTEWEEHLVARTSLIPSSGLGLFSLCKIPSGSTICFYTGSRHSYLSQKSLASKSFLLGVSSFFVDPEDHPSVLARYINDPITSTFHNVKYVERPDMYSCAVVATRDIVEGEEIFVSYGETYWAQQSYDPTAFTVSIFRTLLPSILPPKSYPPFSFSFSFSQGEVVDVNAPSSERKST